MKNILFILKKNECYNFVSYTRRSSGLWNSTRFIVESLRKRNVRATIVEVIDNNCIDREVNIHKPDIVIIEALWVVPEKFEILKKLHPNVKWFVHMHSGLPFLANEGIAADWIYRYSHDQHIGIIANSTETYEAFKNIVYKKHLKYLPNVYISDFQEPKATNNLSFPVINIGCFGAIRPMKNQLTQAISAIQFAKEKDCVLKFFINSSRVETGGEPVLKNIRQLFSHKKHILVECKWQEPDDFLILLRSQIDLGMQVSMSETFNVVSADYVTAGLPVVCSKEVPWISSLNKVSNISDVDSIVDKMHYVWDKKWLVKWNQRLLKKTADKSIDRWFDFVNEA